jgi:hypothetical protein
MISQNEERPPVNESRESGESRESRLQEQISKLPRLDQRAHSFVDCFAECIDDTIKLNPEEPQDDG